MENKLYVVTIKPVDDKYYSDTNDNLVGVFSTSEKAVEAKKQVEKSDKVKRVYIGLIKIDYVYEGFWNVKDNM